jgi:hypothetical protein
LRIACHVNIASGFIEMKKEYTEAIQHCEAALALLEATAAIPEEETAKQQHSFPGIYFRLGHCYRQIHQFTEARTWLSRANEALCHHHHLKAWQEQVQLEWERNAFDQSEFDPEYIRQQQQRQY